MIVGMSGGSLVTGEDAEANVGNIYVFIAKMLCLASGLSPQKGRGYCTYIS